MNVLSNQRNYRLDNIDMLRGLVIVLMALDHVRDYFMFSAQADPTSDPEASIMLYFTRWITHLCAPVFVFLAGTSAGLMLARKTPVELGSFLLKRGCWLVIVEVVIISTAWTFAPMGIPELGGLVLIPMQVIWAIGVCMIVLSCLQFLGRRACLYLGLLLIVGHNMLDSVWPDTSLFEVGAPWWAILHSQTSFTLGPFNFAFIYPVLPWVGIILFGFGAAPVFELQQNQRDLVLLRFGILAVSVFLLLRIINLYGDPNFWQPQDGVKTTLFDFLNITKYPPSMLYTLATLGLGSIFCALARKVPTVVQRPLIIFGRAPFAFYVAHIYLIHFLSAALGYSQGFELQSMFTNYNFFPEGYGVSLLGVYLIWVLVVLVLYPLCQWVTSVKRHKKNWWLSYL